MSIWVTGDCHGDFNRFATKNFPQLKEMGRDDFVIVTGDFGGIWSGEQPDKLTDFLETVKERCRFSKWFFGHYHLDRVIDGRFVVQWEQISRVDVESSTGG